MLNYFKFSKILFKQISGYNLKNITFNKIMKTAGYLSANHNNKFITCNIKKIGLNKFISKNFSSLNDQNSDKDDKEASQNEEIIKYFNEEYEKALTSNEEDQDKRVKLLSVKLLQIKKAKDIINLFEEKYIKGLVSNIYGEELTLFIYFYVSLIEKEISFDSLNPSTIKDLIDKKFEKILTMLKTKLDEIDSTNLLAVAWSISILISKLNYSVDSKLKQLIVEKLPNNLSIEKKGEIPSICFSISNYGEEGNESLNKSIENVISHYSTIFFTNAGLNYINTFNLSLLAMSWAKIKLIDIDLLNKTAEVLKDLKESLTIDNIDEICKLIWVFYIFNYKNETIKEFFTFYLDNFINEIGINHVLDLFVSYTNLFPENFEIVEAIIHLISEKYKESDDLILDIVTYNNLWLAISKFYAKSGKDAIESMPYILNFLFSTYDKRSYLKATFMTPEEVSSMLVCVSVLDLEPNSIYNDLCNYVKSNIDKFNSNLLIQLLSCGKYLFNTKKHSDLYFIIHDACSKTKEVFDNNQIKMIKKILITDGIVTDSIFLNSF